MQIKNAAIRARRQGIKGITKLKRCRAPSPQVGRPHSWLRRPVLPLAAGGAVTAYSIGVPGMAVGVSVAAGGIGVWSVEDGVLVATAEVGVSVAGGGSGVGVEVAGWAAVVGLLVAVAVFLGDRRWRLLRNILQGQKYGSDHGQNPRQLRPRPRWPAAVVAMLFLRHFDKVP